MKRLFNNKVFLSLFMALTFVITPVISVNLFAPTGIYAADPPSLLAEIADWPGADIGWYLADPNANEFYISTPAELYGLSFLVNTVTDDPPFSGHAYNVTFAGKTINLTNNIDLATINSDYPEGIVTFGEIWETIGWGQYTGSTNLDHWAHNPFMGTFDGHGYAVSGLANESLFGMIINATIKNLSTSGTLTTSMADTIFISGVVNTAINSTLINLYSDVGLVFKAVGIFHVGGIVSEAIGDTAVIGCVFNGTLDDTVTEYYGAAPVGGIVGIIGYNTYDTTVTVIDCVNYADLTVFAQGGGIVGGMGGSGTGIKSANIVIENCINYGDIIVAGTNSIVALSSGGILGASSLVANASVTIDSCANYGTINGNLNTAGGIAGYVQQGNLLSITNSYNRSDVTSNVAAGGIVGRVDNATGAVIENTYNTGTITGTNAGGFIGLVNGGTISSSNNYYLDTSAAGAVNSDGYLGATALNDAAMKAPSFATVLGNAFYYEQGDYPLLIMALPQDENVVGITLNGDTATLAGLDASYTVSVTNAKDLATVTLWFEVDGEYLTGKSFTGLNDFEVLGNVVWTDNGDGTFTGRVTLINIDGANGDLDIFAMTYSTDINKLGTTTVKLIGAELTGYDSNVAVEIDSVIVVDTVNTQINQYFSVYDVNHDGKVSQLDITTALFYYGSENGDANWDTAMVADVNGDDIVDIADLILILNNIVW
ncbi:MAG: hypothetical protein FWH51_05555 [Dehalococcoidia bacterium]|nr:hypothetical protein [Dehalococcoidia bacterium]